MAEARSVVIDELTQKLANVLEGSAPKAEALIAATAKRIRAGEQVEVVLEEMYLDVWILLCARVGVEVAS